MRKRAEGLGVDEIFTYKEYKSIVEAIFLKISRSIIVDNLKFIMPYSLGAVYVRRVSAKSVREGGIPRRIDWKSTREKGKLTFFLNKHTFGDFFTISWEKKFVRFLTKSIYIFRPIKTKKAYNAGVGTKALYEHIMKLSEDPNISNYGQS